ncbi:MAG: V-type ATPase subunit [Caldiserica bacterium]|nr:V-type ATPase subunit [Caldisericota bacterium]
MSAYHLAKVRAKLSRMLSEEELRALGDEPLEAALERLRGTPYGRHLGGDAAIAEGLRRGFWEDVAPFFLSLRGRDRALLEAVLARWRVENLKLIVRAKIRGIPSREVEPLLHELPWEKVDYKALLAVPGLEALAKALPWPDYARRIEAVHQQVGDREETFPYEAGLDSLYLERLIHHLAGAGPDVVPILRNRVAKELFLWCFRLKGYGLTFPEMVGVLPDFRPLIPQEELRRIVEDPGGWRGVARFLGPGAEGELSRLEELDLGALGDLFDRDLVSKVRRAFATAPFGVGIVVGYVYLKELELRRLIRLLEGKGVRT